MPDLPSRRRLDRRLPPLPEKQPPFPTEPPLTKGLAELSSFWLDVHCRKCGAPSAYLPLRRLAADYGWRTELRVILPRLRCRLCRQPPGMVQLIDRPDRMQPGNYGPGPGSNVLRIL